MRRLIVALENLLLRTLALGAVCALLVAACGSQQKQPSTTGTSTTASGPRSNTVAIYSSLPGRGPEHVATAQIEQGIELALALAHKRVGRIRVLYKPRSDSPPRRSHGGGGASGTSDRLNGAVTTASGTSPSSWSPNQTVRIASEAARDPQTVAYIGDLNSGATELSLPILNQAGIAQITPGSGYPGLTAAYTKITEPQVEPGKYYPQTPRTLLRMIPSDIVQASAALEVLHRTGCQTVAGWSFGGGAEATALLNAVARTAALYEMKYISPQKLPPVDKYLTYVDALKPTNLRCAVMVGHPTAAAELLTTYLREQLVQTIVGTSGFCTPSWARGIAKTFAKTVVPSLYCMTPYLPIGGSNNAYPKSAAFVTQFKRKYLRAPTAYGYYGYEAAEMVLRALKDIASIDDTRERVWYDLFNEFVPDELGPPPFAFSNGSVVSTKYGVDNFNAAGMPVPYRTVAPSSAYLLPSGG
jgi:branched-chain amino acid transport system substrate-binding protein